MKTEEAKKEVWAKKANTELNEAIKEINALIDGEIEQIEIIIKTTKGTTNNINLIKKKL